MKLSEAIEKLQAQLKEHGDLEVVSVTDVDDVFIVDQGRIFEVIEIPCEEDETHLTKVCAFTEPFEQGPAFKVLR